MQIRHELVKLVVILVGHEQVAACSHFRLAGQLNGTQALAVRALTQHSPVLNRPRLCKVESSSRQSARVARGTPVVGSGSSTLFHNLWKSVMTCAAWGWATTSCIGQPLTVRWCASQKRRISSNTQVISESGIA